MHMTQLLRYSGIFLILMSIFEFGFGGAVRNSNAPAGYGSWWVGLLPLIAGVLTLRPLNHGYVIASYWLEIVNLIPNIVGMTIDGAYSDNGCPDGRNGSICRNSRSSVQVQLILFFYSFVHITLCTISTCPCYNCCPCRKSPDCLVDAAADNSVPPPVFNRAGAAPVVFPQPR